MRNWVYYSRQVNNLHIPFLIEEHQVAKSLFFRAAELGGNLKHFLRETIMAKKKDKKKNDKKKACKKKECKAKDVKKDKKKKKNKKKK